MLGLALAACSGSDSGAGSASDDGSGTAAAAEAAKPARSAADTRAAAMKQVVRMWSRRLNAGDNRGIAELFAVPAVIVQGPLRYRLSSRDEVALWHSGLPCSGKIVSIRVSGRFATAVFVLGDRKTSRCDAPGGRAAARFEIVNGKIRSWEQVPVPSDQATGPSA